MNWKEKYPIILLVIYLIIWIILAVSPKYRSVWIDENILTVLFVVLLVVSYKWFKFSNFSYGLLFVFMILHAIGGHYSYNDNPLFDFLQNMFEMRRNHYDRIVHFLFGIMFFLPIYEVVTRMFKVPKGWRGFFIAFFVVVALKGGFEVIEYAYVWVKSDPLTVSNYLGEQGDSWDAHKDVGLGIIGAMISWMIIGVNRILRKV